MKKTLLTSFIMFSISFPIISSAADLVIVNNTNSDSTSILNGGACSDILGPGGITKAHSKNIVPEKMINKGCIFNKTNCIAEVHMTNNCSGPPIAFVNLNVKTGIPKNGVHPSNTPQGYIVSGEGFYASIDGGPGPSVKSWFKRILGM